MAAVTVVIPVYKGAALVERAISSVLAQTRQDFEIVLVDDGSTDDGWSGLERIVAHNQSVRLLVQDNRGQSAARNAGVRAGSGRYVAFLDQDDEYLPGKLAVTLDFLERNPGCGMVYTNLDVVDGAGSTLSRAALTSGQPPIPLVPHPKRSLYHCLSTDMFVVPGAVVLCREVFESVGGFDESLRGYEDDDLFLRVFQRAPIEFLDVVTLRWSLHAESSSYSTRMDRSRIAYFKKLCRDHPDQPDLNLWWIHDVIVPRFWYAYVGLILSAKRRGDWRRAALLRKDLRQIQPAPWWAVGVKPFLWSACQLALSLAGLQAWQIGSSLLRGLFDGRR
jgi:glycosyltransferase involved in cell wall biosynthesis